MSSVKGSIADLFSVLLFLFLFCFVSLFLKMLLLSPDQIHFLHVSDDSLLAIPIEKQSYQQTGYVFPIGSLWVGCMCFMFFITKKVGCTIR